LITNNIKLKDLTIYRKYIKNKTMKINLLFTLIFGFLILINTSCTDSNAMSGKKENSNMSNTEINKKVADLMAKMTLEEKIGQLTQYAGFGELTGPGAKDSSNAKKIEYIKRGKVGSMLNVVSAEQTREFQELAVNNSRLGIPMMFAYDVIHGYKTMFPIPLGETSSWDMDVLEAGARIAAKEAAAHGLHWTFAPMVDVMRDARWGRVMEGSGEDTYLGTKAGLARVKGFQGDDLSSNATIAACAKHFAGYGFSESGREYNTVEMSEHTLRNVVLPPFKAAADAGVATFMNAFNDLNGVPATGNEHLQRDILKGEWQYDGVMISDWGSIAEIMEHGVAKDLKQASEMAIKAGSDVDMEGYAYEEYLEGLVKEGSVEESLIDDACRRVLKLKFDLGLFEDPYKYCSEEREKNDVLTEEHLEIARDAARKSIVLLKNENDLLPIKETVKSIAVIGPFADDKDSPLGSWRAKAITNSAVSLLEGVKNAVGKDVKVTHAKGVNATIGERSFVFKLNVNKTDKTGIEEAVKVAKSAEMVLLAIGEDCFQSGEARSQVSISLTEPQQALLEAVQAVNKNVVVVLMNGRPMEINWMTENCPAILETWHLGSESGNGIADVLFGKYNPSGKLPMSFPRHVGQCPIYYNRTRTGRPYDESPVVFWSHYADVENTPLYPFGFGLSYTTFEYKNLKLDKASMPIKETLTVSVEVTNTGSRDGHEVVQLYIRDIAANVTRPIKELKGFEKVLIKAGETKTISFKLTEAELGFYNRKSEFGAEAGDFKIFVGGNSDDLLETDFELK
jgi:beta-glucosidase